MKPYEIYTVLRILQMRKLRHREVTYLAKGYTTTEWRSGFVFRQSGSGSHVISYLHFSR